MERRERDRVQVELECRVDWQGQPGAELSNTLNISRTGMLLRWQPDTSALPAIGDEMIVRLKMPRNPAFDQRWMVFRAQVVRVSRTQQDGLVVAVNGSPVRFSAGSDETTFENWMN